MSFQTVLNLSLSLYSNECGYLAIPAKESSVSKKASWMRLRIAAKGKTIMRKTLEVVQQKGIQVSHKKVPAQMLRAKTKSGWAQQKAIRIPGPSQRE